MGVVIGGLASAILYASYILNVDTRKMIFYDREVQVEEVCERNIEESKKVGLDSVLNSNIKVISFSPNEVSNVRYQTPDKDDDKMTPCNDSEYEVFSERRLVSADYLDFRANMFFEYFRNFLKENEYRFGEDYVDLRLRSMFDLVCDASKILRDEAISFDERVISAKEKVREVDMIIRRDFINQNNEKIFGDVLIDFTNLLDSVGDLFFLTFQDFSVKDSTIEISPVDYGSSSSISYIRISDYIY